MAQGEVLQNDSDWVREIFHLSNKYAAGVGVKTGRRNYNRSRYKFYDTTPGGYRALNPVPQLTRFADIKSRSRNPKSRSMGRYYSEAYDDNAQIIHVRCGLPEYNSLSNFLSNMYEPTAGKLARTGEGQSFIGAMASAAGYILSIPLIPLVVGWRWIGALANDVPYNKFYYSKPAMPLYWSAFQAIATKLAVNLKLLTPEEPSAAPVDNDNFHNQTFTVSDTLDASGRRQLASLLPDVFDPDSGINIFALSTRFQALANAEEEAIANIMNSAGSAEDAYDKLDEHFEKDVAYIPPAKLSSNLQAYVSSGLAKSNPATEVEPQEASQKDQPENEAKNFITQAYDDARETLGSVGDWFAESKEFFDAEVRGGSQWVSLRVENTGTVSESFSNQTGESPLAQKINEASAQAKAAKFSFAGGNVGDGAVAGVIEGIAGLATSAISGVGSALGFSGIGALLGGGFIEIPKYWENSTAEVARGSYTVKLRTPYGNRLSIFKDLYIPLAGILAMALPMSAGPSAFTSPFLIELFDKGRLQTRLGMIENLMIERGTGNLGWSVDGLPLGIDISFDVVDLDTIMHMPISGESLSFNDQSMYQNYMAVLGGLGPLEQTTAMAKFKRKKQVLQAEWDTWWSPAHFAQWAGDTTIGRIWQGVEKNPKLF